MDISIHQVERVLRTLPLSLYTKRDGITMSLSEFEEGTYYNPLKDAITISFPMIKAACKKVAEGNDELLEKIIRALLYHEVSHAMITPKDLMDERNSLKRSVYNVFEDERIETIFRHYYYGVDFKKNVFIINNYTGAEPKDAFQAFYNIVRFRYPNNPKTQELINKYKNLSVDHGCYGYQNDIWNYFLEIAKDFMEENEKEKLEEVDPNYDNASDAQKKWDVEKAVMDELGNNIGPGILCDEDGTPLSEKELEELEEAIGKLVEEAKEAQEGKASKSLEESPTDKKGPISKTERTEAPQKMLETTANKFYDKELIDEMSAIFQKFIKRGNQYKGSYASYSGTLNPHAFSNKGLRESWRIFQRESSDEGVKGKKKLKINLFIDTSGSYRGNQDRTNTLLRAMIEIERKFNFFTFDLVTCQCGETLRTKDERYIEASGGNNLDSKIFGIFKQLQDPQAFNYNIVLFDGDAFSDCYRSGNHANFGAFNVSNCCIISDSDNEADIKKYAPKASTTIVKGYGKSYAQLLTQRVVAELSRALA